MVELELLTYRVEVGGISGCGGWLISSQNSNRAIMRVRSEAEREEAEDDLLKKAERGHDELPAMIARLSREA